MILVYWNNNMETNLYFLMIVWRKIESQ